MVLGHDLFIATRDATSQYCLRFAKMSVTETDPPFRAMVRASGLAEVWTHSTESSKFNQFGWRCTNKENSFSNDTLIGNWNEERFDNDIAKQARRIPGQVSMYLIFLSYFCFYLYPK